MRLVRVAPGRYATTGGGYLVERTADGWRWLSATDPSTGGEWRATKRTAADDLFDYLLTRRES
jgi:hypothetical protein